MRPDKDDFFVLPPFFTNTLLYLPYWPRAESLTGQAESSTWFQGFNSVMYSRKVSQSFSPAMISLKLRYTILFTSKLITDFILMKMM